MRVTRFIGAGVLLLCAAGNAAAQQGDYVPGKGEDWAHKTPQEAGFDPAKLKKAVDFAIGHETKYTDERAGVVDVRDLRLKTALDRAHEPFSDPIGPFKRRAAANGIILRGGYIVAEWGQTHEVDMTFSISKTFLNHVAGIAHDRKMIRNVNDPVRDYVLADHFSSEHNAPITWDQMLRQTSGWSGTLFGKPDWADRPGDKPWTDLLAGPKPPGKHWEYNDTRVNLLALALLHLWQRPLPEVLKEHVMDPIGASDGWHWEGYRNSYVEIGGERVQSVAGGGHWGGGMFISAHDLARLGLLGLRRGQWGDKRILSEEWFRKSLTPTEQNPGYGYMNFFLNAAGAGRPAPFPKAPKDAFAYFGAGVNMVYIDPAHDLVAVVRWIDRESEAEFVRLLLEAVK
ncbi:MAG: serine hydrolase domain-containing protein [Alphaproteobacteria bacterium]